MARKVSRATRSANGRLAHDPLYMWCIRRRRSGEPALDHSVERIDDDRQEVRDAAGLGESRKQHDKVKHHSSDARSRGDITR